MKLCEGPFQSASRRAILKGITPPTAGVRPGLPAQSIGGTEVHRESDLERMPLQKLLGRNIRLSRHVSNLSEAGLANILDIAPTRLRLFERGELNPTLRTVEDMASLMGIPAAKLFDPYSRGLPVT